MFETCVIDDLFTEEQIQQTLLEVLNGPWKYIHDMSYGHNQFPSYGFNQTFKHPEHGIMSTGYERICVPIINKVIESSPSYLKVNDIYFTRSFLQIPLDPKFVKGTNGVHVDLPIDHVACVYYCNDCDGETVIYDQTNKEIPGGSKNIDLTVHKKVMPKAGRVVLFDGSRYHCSSQPTVSMRTIINFDLV